jgi:hypothetical protein
MSGIYYIVFDTIVFEITRENNLDKILAYQIDKKESPPYIFLTEKRIPEVLEIYRKTISGRYPAAFIFPSPSVEIIGKATYFDDQFFLIVAYTEELPLYVPFDKLISVSKIIIYEDDPQKIEVIGACGSDALNILMNNNNLNNDNDKNKKELKLRHYTIDLRKANLNNLTRFFIYNSVNKQSNKDGEMKVAGTYIFIGEDENLSCKQSYIAPKDIKILEFYK